MRKRVTELAKAYEPKQTEEKWYAYWESNNFFKADPTSDKEPFCVMIPPPNVTGVLHMGHGLVDTLIDTLCRFKRMKGFEVHWQAGTDHAGISTQTVVEKHLIKTEGKRRKDYSREEFLTHVWNWKEQCEDTIISQLKKLGCSADWSTQKFTMDPDLTSAVQTLFKTMFDAGLIYRGDYLVNWDPVTQTALADDEVEYEEKQGFLYHFNYITEDGTPLTIATTRPETLLGDTGIAVSPSDERYSHLIGKTATVPFVDRKIPIIADHHVDKEFGTGVVKITPAHDPNDYEIGMRHDLPMVNIMTPDARINENGAQFAGLTMEAARNAIIAALKDEGLFVKQDPHTHRVGISYRSKAVIEPYLSKQWFVKLSSFKEELLDAVDSGEVELVPAYWESTYKHWINNLRDWCISRQLWWGHRIPIWYNTKNPEQMICHVGNTPPHEALQNPDEWVQDEDVLDTWFSSALWPFSTLGWPEKTDMLETFYPNATLMTGHDILFFWVARMLFMGKYATGKFPFKQTFLHGLIYGKSYWRQDKEHGAVYVSHEEKKQFDMGEPLPKDVHSKWEKMSKSKGNVIDPLEIIESYGTDAMRMALISSATHARQIDLDRRRFEEFKNFANKVWNGARFVLMNLDIDRNAIAEGIHYETLTLDDKWILSRLHAVTQDLNKHINEYKFDYAAKSAYEFFWNDFCAVYVESTKPYLFGKLGTKDEALNKKRVLAVVLLAAIRLLHPMAPFITEELFQTVKGVFKGTAKSEEPITQEFLEAIDAKACIVAPYPEPLDALRFRPELIRSYETIQECVKAIRNIRAEMGIPPSVKTPVHIFGNIDSIETLLALTPTTSIEKEMLPEESFHAKAMVDEITIAIPLPEELKEKERARIDKEIGKLEKTIASISGRLSNKQFVDRAPEELVNQTKAQLATSQEMLKKLSKKKSQL